jgi:hypothetical protein
MNLQVCGSYYAKNLLIFFFFIDMIDMSISQPPKLDIFVSLKHRLNPRNRKANLSIERDTTMTKRVKCDKCGKKVAESQIIYIRGYNLCEHCLTLLISSMRML